MKVKGEKMKVREVLEKITEWLEDFEFDFVDAYVDAKVYQGEEALEIDIGSFAFGEDDGWIWFAGFDNDEGDYKVTERDLKKARKDLKELVERTREKWARILVGDGYSVF